MKGIRQIHLEREVRGSRPTSAVLCPWARHFTPRKYWLITKEAMAPSRHDWKIVDWDVKPQHNQPNSLTDSLTSWLTWAAQNRLLSFFGWTLNEILKTFKIKF